ncbi:hypothetical protein [Streptomyces sp. JJ38]|uniref:hypothetical protein n=1 Tax=Streptomyces sp. JJ38 TaxID=2738128 RepID=UPI001C55C017|nr:hypothetical protein [Streptomyces sp. JJ38]MBW1598655.1 hypothetical protein [Streptomyces sp. JJ38]
MTTGTKDSPATLYGTTSLALGVVALIAAVFSGLVGIAVPLLCGSLAATFAAFGLRKGLNRAQCAVGLATGGLAVLYVLFLVATFSA